MTNHSSCPCMLSGGDLRNRSYSRNVNEHVGVANKVRKYQKVSDMLDVSLGCCDRCPRCHIAVRQNCVKIRLKSCSLIPGTTSRHCQNLLFKVLSWSVERNLNWGGVSWIPPSCFSSLGHKHCVIVFVLVLSPPPVPLFTRYVIVSSCCISFWLICPFVPHCVLGSCEVFVCLIWVYFPISHCLVLILQFWITDYHCLMSPACVLSLNKSHAK